MNNLSRTDGAAYDIQVFAHVTATGAFDAMQRVVVQMALVTPHLFIDTPSPNATVSPTFRIAGWAVELNGVSGTGVDTIHVWATPSDGGPGMFLGAAHRPISVYAPTGTFAPRRHGSGALSATSPCHRTTGPALTKPGSQPRLR